MKLFKPKAKIKKYPINTVYDDCYNFNLVVNTDEYKNKLDIINSHDNLSDDMKNVLKLLATRFIVFDYRAIAEYYSTCKEKDIKKILRELCAVILDEANLDEGYAIIEKNVKKYTLL